MSLMLYDSVVHTNEHNEHKVLQTSDGDIIYPRKLLLKEERCRF